MYIISIDIHIFEKVIIHKLMITFFMIFFIIFRVNTFIFRFLLLRLLSGLLIRLLSGLLSSLHSRLLRSLHSRRCWRCKRIPGGLGGVGLLCFCLSLVVLFVRLSKIAFCFLLSFYPREVYDGIYLSPRAVAWYLAH